MESSSSSPLPSVLIGTHNGSFHSDEAAAIWMLQQLPPYSPSSHDVTIVRTRDPSLLSQCNILVDVGAKYDPSHSLFDHHQREFTETFSPNFSIKLSSAGMIYKHFGKEIIQKYYQKRREILIEKENGTDDNVTMFYPPPSSLPPILDDISLTTIFNRFYSVCILCFDGIDNGVSQYDSNSEPKYQNKSDLSSRVQRLNLDWNEKGNDKIVMERFLLAVGICGEEITQQMNSTLFSWFPARELVFSALKLRHHSHSSGRVLCLSHPTNWKSHLYDLESEMKLSEPNENNILFVIFEDSAPSGGWRIQGVPIHENSFECRQFLPEEWRGLRDDKLSQITGVSEATFVHPTGFIGGAKTKEGAMEMANKSVEQRQRQRQQVNMSDDNDNEDTHHGTEKNKKVKVSGASD